MDKVMHLFEWASDEYVDVDPETEKAYYKFDYDKIKSKGKELGLTDKQTSKAIEMLKNLKETTGSLEKDSQTSFEECLNMTKIVLKSQYPELSQEQIEDKATASCGGGRGRIRGFRVNQEKMGKICYSCLKDMQSKNISAIIYKPYEFKELISKLSDVKVKEVFGQEGLKFKADRLADSQPFTFEYVDEAEQNKKFSLRAHAEMSYESNYGADADGNRGMSTWFIEDVIYDEWFIDGVSTLEIKIPIGPLNKLKDMAEKYMDWEVPEAEPEEWPIEKEESLEKESKTRQWKLKYTEITEDKRAAKQYMKEIYDAGGIAEEVEGIGEGPEIGVLFFIDVEKPQQLIDKIDEIKNKGLFNKEEVFTLVSPSGKEYTEEDIDKIPGIKVKQSLKRAKLEDWEVGMPVALNADDRTGTITQILKDGKIIVKFDDTGEEEWVAEEAMHVHIKPKESSLNKKAVGIEDISEEDLQAYEDVRKSGATNMFAVNVVQDMSGLDRETILAIMKSYSELIKKYPNVRESSLKKEAELSGTWIAAINLALEKKYNTHELTEERLPGVADYFLETGIIKPDVSKQKIMDFLKPYIGKKFTHGGLLKKEAGKEDYIKYLKETYIPDLRESGKDATADDFETMIDFIEGKEKSHGYTPETFRSFLESTLIPDLKESGDDATIEDFEEGLDYLYEILEPKASLKINAQKNGGWLKENMTSYDLRKELIGAEVTMTKDGPMKHNELQYKKGDKGIVKDISNKGVAIIQIKDDNGNIVKTIEVCYIEDIKRTEKDKEEPRTKLPITTANV